MAVKWGMTRVRMGMDGLYLATNRAVRPVLLYTMIRLACRAHPCCLSGLHGIRAMGISGCRLQQQQCASEHVHVSHSSPGRLLSALYIMLRLACSRYTFARVLQHQVAACVHTEAAA